MIAGLQDETENLEAPESVISQREARVTDRQQLNFMLIIYKTQEIIRSTFPSHLAVTGISFVHKLKYLQL
jgi:hypothetical protein